MNDIIPPLGENSLDLDFLKQKYREYVIDNSIIKDVDYEGSNVSIFIDIMSYIEKNINSTLALNSNQTMLLLSSVRQNIIYQAQGVNSYNITRPISSKMSITISTDLSVTESVTIPQWQKFICGDYTFYNPQSIILTDSQPSATIDIIEGLYIDSSIDSSLLKKVTVDTDKISFSYNNIENNNVSYRIKRDGDSEFSDFYIKTETLTSLNNEQSLFYEEIDAETEFLTIFNSFAGQGNILKENDTYEVSFLLSNGLEANGILVCEFSGTFTSNLNNEKSFTVTVNSASRGGTDTESNESIKRNAPQFYNTGFRTVTAPDYSAFLERNSLVEIAKAWGGEVMNPINLGHVYLCSIPQDEAREYLTSLEEVELLQYLRPMIATGRIFKHPNYLIVDYDVKILGSLVSIEDKQNQIIESMNSYFAENHNKFSTSFFESKSIRVMENLFLNERDASIRVTVKPKIQLDLELFSQFGGNIEIYIPNSPKRYYLIKGNDRIDIPNDRDEYYSYLLNGWTKQEDLSEALTISFSGTINSKAVTEGTTENGTINGDTYDFKRIYLDGNEIGQFNIELDILNLTDISADLPTTQFIELTYSPAMNIISEKSTIIKLGAINYV